MFSLFFCVFTFAAMLMLHWPFYFTSSWLGSGWLLWNYLLGDHLEFFDTFKYCFSLLFAMQRRRTRKAQKSLKLSHCPMYDDHFRPRSKISQFFHAWCLSSGTAQNQPVYSRLETRGFEAYWVFPAVWLQSYQRNQCE